MARAAMARHAGARARNARPGADEPDPGTKQRGDAKVKSPHWKPAIAAALAGAVAVGALAQALAAEDCQGTALEAGGCRNGGVTIIRSSPADDDGAPQAEIPQLGNGVVIHRSGESFQQYGGEYRTSCVRTCDGYSFPMSSAATIGDFQRDQARCEAACPGADVEMFYERDGSGDLSRMISSVTGTPYAWLPNAFVYKRLDIARAPGCGCGASRATSVVGILPGTPAPPLVQRPGSSIIEAGSGKRAVETAAPEAGNVDRSGQEIEADRKVRVVGPVFLPGPLGATGRQAPAPRQAP
jgi:hypothetical protein